LLFQDRPKEVNLGSFWIDNGWRFEEAFFRVCASLQNFPRSAGRNRFRPSAFGAVFGWRFSMSDETSKTNLLRGQAFFDAYFSSSVIDVGCGDDVVAPHARPFDVAHGDANCITKFVSETFACVHSSHCLV
jgi:hypothetical protein